MIDQDQHQGLDHAHGSVQMEIESGAIDVENMIISLEDAPVQ